MLSLREASEISILTINLQHQNRLQIRTFPLVTCGTDYIGKMTDGNEIFTLPTRYDSYDKYRPAHPYRFATCTGTMAHDNTEYQYQY